MSNATKNLVQKSQQINLNNNTNNPSNNNQTNNQINNHSNNEKREFVTSNYIKEYINAEITNNIKTNAVSNATTSISSNKACSSIKVDFPSSTEKKSSSNNVANVTVKPRNVLNSLKISTNIMSPNSATSGTLINPTNTGISTKNPNTVKGKLSEVKLNDFKPSQLLAKPHVTTKPKHNSLLQNSKLKK